MKKKHKKALAIVGATTIGSIALVGCNSEFNPFYNEPMKLYGSVNKEVDDLSEIHKKMVEEEEENKKDKNIEFNPENMEIMEMYGPFSTNE